MLCVIMLSLLIPMPGSSSYCYSSTIQESVSDDARFEFEAPVRLMADGKPIQVESPGYASPTVVDLDRDGKEDLVVGQFAGGRMKFFRNLASIGENPRYGAGKWIESENGPAMIPGIRCCTGATPQFVDWNQDGRLDILSGSYAAINSRHGHLHLLFGLPNGKFQAAQTVFGSDNQTLTTDGVGSDPVQSTMDTLCTHPHAADFDGDGDLDLWVGTNGGRVFYFVNKGDAKAPQLNQPPQTLSIKVNGYRSAPHVVDWDGDGDLDLMVGTHDGSVYWIENIGKPDQPAWTSAKTLLRPTGLVDRLNNSGSRGDSARVWVTDWNNDGIKDLIVGDRAVACEALPHVSAEHFQTNEKRLISEGENILKLDSGNSDPNSQKKLKAETERKLQELLSQRKLWAREVGQGFVWLYLGKDNRKATVRGTK